MASDMRGLIGEGRICFSMGLVSCRSLRIWTSTASGAMSTGSSSRRRTYCTHLLNTFRLCLGEVGLRDATVVADKGFGSKENFELMEVNSICDIAPLLRRNNSAFDNAKQEYADKRATDGYFLFNSRPIRACETPEIRACFFARYAS